MGRKLHIGGKQQKEGWEILDAENRPEVDHVCNAKKLSCFPDNTFESVYASHVLEHINYGKETVDVLKEWRRVLIPEGKLYISVPDMDICCSLFLNKQLSFQDRFEAMRFLFGGHTNEFDFHHSGINKEILSSYLHEAGFVRGEHLENQSFGIFIDSSAFKFRGVHISLNIIAYK